MSSIVMRRVMIRLNRTGPGLPEQASWPFTKVVIQPGTLTVKLFGTKLSFTPDTIAPLEEYTQAFSYGAYANEHGFQIIPTSPVVAGKNPHPLTRIDIAMRPHKNYANTVMLLRACGFKVKQP